jgi:hypothetical protein
MVNQAKIHVLIHVCLFETFTSDTVAEKYTWLNVDVVTSKRLVFHAFLEELLV